MRARTLDLVDLSEDDQRRQHSPLMSPLVWDLAHVGNYEELWLLRAVGGRPRRSTASLDDLYDAFQHPRPDRPSLPLLGPAEARRLHRRRPRPRPRRARDGRRSTPAQPLLDGGFVYGMVVQHEHQHDETMLATLQLMARAGEPPAGARPRRRPPPCRTPARPRCCVPGGPFAMGTDLEPWAYDNERPAHEVDVAAFRIDTAPVTNGAYAEFVADGGYDEPRVVDGRRAGRGAQEAGPAPPRVLASATAPAAGRGCASAPREPLPRRRAGAARLLVRGRRLRPLGRASACPPRPSGRRPRRGVPTGASAAGPWGDEPPDGRARQPRPAPRPARAGRRPTRPAPARCGVPPDDRRRVGVDVVATSRPTPASRSFPYREYSEVFFGPDYKVLRGGSWATAPAGGAHHVPQLGLPHPPPDLRRLPLRPGRRLAHVPPPGLPRARPSRCTSLLYEPAALAARAVVGAAAPARGRRQRRRLSASAGTTSTRRPEPARYRTARPMWTDRSFASLAGVVHVDRRPGRRAQRHAAVADRGDRHAAVHRRAVAVRPQRQRRRASATGVGHAAAPAAERASATRGIVGHERHRGALRPRPRPPRRGLPARRGAGRRSSTPSPPRTGGRLNLLADRRRTGSRPPPRATRCIVARRPSAAVVVASEPFDDDPGWEPVPDALAGRGHAPAT